MGHLQLSIILLATIFGLAAGCRKGPDPPPPPTGPAGHGTTPYTLDIPAYFPPISMPPDNPLTEQGVLLGRFLFYEERLSHDNNMSCASCHAPSVAFTDSPNRVSMGVQGIQGTRNSMALINLAWDTRFFWDGRAHTLEEQVLFPVRDPIEMHETWPNAMSKLQSDPAYVDLYRQAFGTTTIDSLGVAKAIAQFLRTMISANSKFDRFKRNELMLSDEEEAGLMLTRLEGGAVGGADCFHCHPDAVGLFSIGELRNNGLDSVFTDLGLGGVTGLPQDMGKFKIPTLRNIALTAPYMHDGRFQTLEEVIDHYDSGGHPSATIDPNMKYTTGGLMLTPEKKAQLLAFLHTLTDMDFVNDERFSDPGPP